MLWIYLHSSYVITVCAVVTRWWAYCYTVMQHFRDKVLCTRHFIWVICQHMKHMEQYTWLSTIRSEILTTLSFMLPEGFLDIELLSLAFLKPIVYFLNFPSVLWHYWLRDRQGTRPVKRWVLVSWWWQFDTSFACLTAPVVTTTSITLSSNKIRVQTFWYWLTQVKWPLKWREYVYFLK